MSLPNIDLENITTLAAARNAIEDLLQISVQQQEEIERLRTEIARLKGQPKKPSFSTLGKHVPHGVTNLLKEKRTWHKSSKGRFPIDHEEQLTEVDRCLCGNAQFRTLRTTTKVVQGIIFQRNNTAYRGRHKQRINCGNIYKSILPEEIKGISFDQKIRSLLSYLKFACRMTYPLSMKYSPGRWITIDT